MSASLENLPFDIFHTIACRLDIHDYVNLENVSRKLRSLLRSDSTARICLQRNIASERTSDPTGHTPTFRKELGRIASGRTALETARPYSASIVAYGTQFTCDQGFLCYVNDSQIRCLDIYGCSRIEQVIDAALIHNLTRKSLSPARSYDSDPMISLLSCTRDVLVYLYEMTEAGDTWLFALDLRQTNGELQIGLQPRRRLLLRQQIGCATKFFVRHNGLYLYYGTHSALGSHGHHEWMIQGVDLATGLPVTEKPLQLVGFVGSEVGSTTCFEIHDGLFYAVTNQTSFETEEVDWTSYYHCIQFDVCERKPDLQPRKIWRRQHLEGPINDSWTELSLQTDERTGELLLVECRREWLGGGSANVRTYYTQPLALTPGQDIAVSYGLPSDDPLIRTLDDSSKPSYEPAKKRLRRYCHSEYPARTPAQDFILAKTKFRAYNPVCSALIDLVNDPAPRPNSSRLRDRLRLRVASRKQKPPLITDPEKPGHFLLRKKELDENDVLLDGSEDDFYPSDIHIWPPEDAPTSLADLLCPSGRVGQIDAVANGKSIVYMTDPSPDTPNSQRAIILISFDPAWGHEGLERLTLASGSSGMVDLKVGSDSPRSSSARKKRPFPVLAKGDDNSLRSYKKLKCTASSSSTLAGQQLEEQRPRFMRAEEAMYLSINQGFWLERDIGQ